MNSTNITWGILFTILGIFGLYHSYSKFMSYQETGKISYTVKYMYFTGEKALLLTSGNVLISIIFIYFGYLLLKRGKKPNKNEETNRLP